MMDADALERLRLRLVHHRPETRRQALAEAQALPEPERLRLVVACDILGQHPLSDEVVILLARSWSEWPLLTSLRLESCHLLTRVGCEVIGRQGRITDLGIGGGDLIDDAAIAALTTLPLERLELWEGGGVTAAGARALAGCRTLRRLEWQNAPADPAVTAAIAASASITALTYTGKGFRPAVLAPVGRMERLVELGLFGSDDEVVAGIAHLPLLERLRLDNAAGVTDEGLGHLRRLPRLRSLSLSFATLDDAGLRQLGGMPGLEALSLWGDGQALTDASADALSPLVRLRRLEASVGPGWTDAAIGRLSRLSALEELRLHGGSGIGDVAMRHLAQMTLLTVLELPDSGIGDAGAATIAGFPALAGLSLRGSAITAAALRPLGSLTGLRRLDLRECRGVVAADGEPWLGMRHLEALLLPATAPLQAVQTRRLAQSCRSLWRLSCALGDGGALAPLALADRLRSLRIVGAGGMGDDDLAQLGRLRELSSLAIVDAPWLTDRGIAALEGMPSLRDVGIAGCPGVSPVAFRQLADRRHLQHFGRSGRQRFLHGEFIVLRGQLVTDGHGPIGWSGREEPVATAAELIARATAPVVAADASGPRRWFDLDDEELAEAAIAALEGMGSVDAIDALAQAMRIQPTRWAYAGWALVRLARRGSAAAAAALERASEHPEDVDLRVRARRFLRQLDAGAG